MSAAPDARAETELLERVQRGETQAYGPLLEPYRALLRHLAWRLCLPGVALPEEELVQAGYVGLMQAAQRFDPGRGTRFITYAVPWALGEMRAALRASFGAPGAGTVSIDAQTQEGGRTLGDVLQGEPVREETIELHLALSRLDGQARRVIAMRYFEDRTQAEAARLMGSSQAQVSRLERRALDTLRALLL